MMKRLIAILLAAALMLSVFAVAAYAEGAGSASTARGDADGNGVVNNRDAMILDRYIAGWEGYEGIIADMDAVDVDGNGVVNNRDAVILDRYVADWDGYDVFFTSSVDPQPTEPAPTEPPTEAPTEPAKPAVPEITKVESGNKGVVVTWDAFEGAELYRVFYKTGNNSWKKLGDTADTTFTHTDAPYNVECTYTVRCVDKDGNFTSDYDKEGYKNTRLNNPKLSEAKLLDYYIGLSWEAVEGASYYRVYIKGGEYTSWTWAYDTDINYVDINVASAGLVSNTKYTFTVRCVDDVRGERMLSGYDTAGVSLTYYETPFIYGIVNAEKGIELYWTEVEGAAKYRVYEMTADGWKKLTDIADTAILITGFNEGDSARFTVRGLDSKGNLITSYDSFGREMDWNPKLVDYTSSFDPDFILRDVDSYAGEKGFTRNDEAIENAENYSILALDSSAYYAGGSYSLEQWVMCRIWSLLDGLVKMLKRNGETPEHYIYTTYATDPDECGDVYLYFVFAHVEDVK